MYPKRMIMVGAIMVLVAIAIIAFGIVMIGEEEDAFNIAARFDGSRRKS
jgi:hypothetical protein